MIIAVIVLAIVSAFLVVAFLLERNEITSIRKVLKAKSTDIEGLIKVIDYQDKRLDDLELRANNDDKVWNRVDAAINEKSKEIEHLNLKFQSQFNDIWHKLDQKFDKPTPDKLDRVDNAVFSCVNPLIDEDEEFNKLTVSDGDVKDIPVAIEIPHIVDGEVKPGNDYKEDGPVSEGGDDNSKAD